MPTQVIYRRPPGGHPCGAATRKPLLACRGQAQTGRPVLPHGIRCRPFSRTDRISHRFDTSTICNASLPKRGGAFGCSTSPATFGIPCFVAIPHWMQNGPGKNIEFDSGAHFDPRIALLRALAKLNQFLSLGLIAGGTGESRVSTAPRHCGSRTILI